MLIALYHGKHFKGNIIVHYTIKQNIRGMRIQHSYIKTNSSASVPLFWNCFANYHGDVLL